MKVTLKPLETVQVNFADTDGEYLIIFGESSTRAFYKERNEWEEIHMDPFHVPEEKVIED